MTILDFNIAIRLWVEKFLNGSNLPMFLLVMAIIEGSENLIPLVNVHSEVLKKVIEFCAAHKREPTTIPKEVR